MARLVRKYGRDAIVAAAERVSAHRKAAGRPRRWWDQPERVHPTIAADNYDESLPSVKKRIREGIKLEKLAA